MILTFEQAVELIKNPRSKDKLELSVKKYNELNMQVNGVGYKKKLEKIDGYENTEQKLLKDKLAKSNKETFSKLLRTIDKVFSAKGGSKQIEIENEKIRSEFISTKYKGYSLPKWIQNNINKYYVDPNGLFFVEVEDGKAYPTYKSSKDIHDYYINGLDVEYVIFNPYEVEEGSKYYRVVDDKTDFIIKNISEDYYLIEDEIYKNEYGKVPAIVISELPDNVFDIFASPIEQTMETADEFMQNAATKTVYKYLHFYPIFWRYLDDCNNCNGTGQIKGEKCPVCTGTGYKTTKDVSDVVGVPIPQEGEPTITPVAGYIQPDLDTLEEMRVELKDLYKDMEFSLYGTNRENATNETATGRWIDTQPVNDALMAYSDWYERTEQELTNIIGKIMYKDVYKGSSIKAGRRYMIEPADVIFKRYLEAKEKGTPKATLDMYLLQYYSAVFANDPKQLNSMVKRIALEPFAHHSDEEVQGLEVNELDYYKKVYYDEWAKTLTKEELDNNDYNKLDISLTTYATQKLNNKTKIEE